MPTRLEEIGPRAGPGRGGTPRSLPAAGSPGGRPESNHVDEYADRDRPRSEISSDRPDPPTIRGDTRRIRPCRSYRPCPRFACGPASRTRSYRRASGRPRYVTLPCTSGSRLEEPTATRDDDPVEGTQENHETCPEASILHGKMSDDQACVGIGSGQTFANSVTTEWLAQSRPTSERPQSECSSGRSPSRCRANEGRAHRKAGPRQARGPYGVATHPVTLQEPHSPQVIGIRCDGP